MMSHRRSAATAALALGAVLVGVVGFAAPASAHVTVNPREDTQGGYCRLSFRVPNESDTASTIKLEVHLPEDAPVGSVSTMPVPGWTVTTEKRKIDQPIEVHGSQITEVVSKITWTAEKDAGIKPGEFLEFPVSMGPLPKTDRMIFKALQTYSDGKVARWIEEPVEGGHPDYPAPVLTLLPADDSHGSSDSSDTVEATHQPEKSDGVARGLGVAGLVAGLAGLVLGALAFVRGRKPSGSSAS